MLSGLFAVVEYFDYCEKRRRRGLPSLKLFTLDSERIDWFGWGDWMYLAASLLGFIECLDESMWSSEDDDTPNAIYLTSKYIFMYISI